MATFVLLTKVSSEGAKQVRSLAEMDREFDAKLRQLCPEVKRIASYALLGAYDFLHIFEAPDARVAAKVALIANSFGVATTQTLTAIPFHEFKEILEEV
ncbi:MAG: GYD domain-containing protein [Anaerolineae bacterium]|nr:GYD domain-containing protein [Anaerolineae bacterium]